MRRILWIIAFLAILPARAESADATPWVPPGSALVVEALSLIGTPYRYSGEDPAGGFDCSGLMSFIFKDALGEDIPHSAAQLFHWGSTVDRQDLQAGDLLFFSTHHGRISHVALYIGNGQFVHAPNTGATVRIDRLDSSYWQRAFRGARRLVSENLALQLPEIPSRASLP